VLVTHPSNPANSLAEFIAWAKGARAPSLRDRSGQRRLLAGELFLPEAGLKIQYVPYKGSGPAAATSSAATSLYVVGDLHRHAVREGRAPQALSIAGRARATALPDVPTRPKAEWPTSR